MSRMVAYCGIVCTECPAYIATQKDDDSERRKVAKQWSDMFEVEIRPESINCDGCLTSGGRLIDYCATCEIRKCGVEKDVENCAHCDDYVCERLGKWFQDVPDAKATLDEIKKSLPG
jgi:hypothetical protein